jgi:glycerate-2-kinase
VTDLKEIAKRVFLQTLNAIEPGSAVNQKLRVEGDTLTIENEQLSLDAYSEVVLIGIGKASLKMAAAVEILLGDRIKRGVLVTNRRSRVPVRSEVVVAGHPLPNANSLKAAEKIVEMVESCSDESLIIFLISGGGSSLVELPLSPLVSLEDLRAANQVLIGSGASIREINIVRKCLSKTKGGRLGRLAKKSKCLALYLSDVNTGDILSIASNPLLPEPGGAEEFFGVVDKLDLMRKFPRSVTSAIGSKHISASEPKGNSGGEDLVPRLVLDNTDAIEAAASLARQYGFRVKTGADLIEGDYRSIADRSIEQLIELKSSFPGERVCLISGGEVSCPVRGAGIGGRNQEFVLYCATLLACSSIRDGAAVLSCGTDGIDGNSNAAGAVADAESAARALQLGALPSSFISNNDSHSYFRKMGGLVVTGPTGNNVRDLRILMTE